MAQVTRRLRSLFSANYFEANDQPFFSPTLQLWPSNLTHSFVLYPIASHTKSTHSACPLDRGPSPFMYHVFPPYRVPCFIHHFITTRHAPTTPSVHAPPHHPRISRAHFHHPPTPLFPPFRMQLPQPPLLRKIAARILTLVPLLPLPYSLLIRGLGVLLGAHPSRPHRLLGTLLKLLNPLYDISIFLPVLPLVGALILLIPGDDPASHGPWAVLFPFLSAMLCEPLCGLASRVVSYEGIVMNEGGVGDTVIFGEDMGQGYHSLVVLGFFIPVARFMSPIVFGLLYIVRKALITSRFG